MPPGPLTRAVADVLHEALDANKKVTQASIGRTNKGEPGYISQPQLSRVFDHTKDLDVDQLGALCTILGLPVLNVIEAAEARIAGNVTPIRRRSVGPRRETVRRVARKKDAESGEEPTQ